MNYYKAGNLYSHNSTGKIDDVLWNDHPSFSGVQLKDAIARDKSTFSMHIVKIEPGKAIGEHVHDDRQEVHIVLEGEGTCMRGGGPIEYHQGDISIIAAGTAHSVQAGSNGLLMVAVFY